MRLAEVGDLRKYYPLSGRGSRAFREWRKAQGQRSFGAK
jgi:DNA-binding PadR family transcriptional regulator